MENSIVSILLQDERGLDWKYSKRFLFLYPHLINAYSIISSFTLLLKPSFHCWQNWCYYLERGFVEHMEDPTINVVCKDINVVYVSNTMMEDPIIYHWLKFQRNIPVIIQEFLFSKYCWGVCWVSKWIVNI